MPKCVITTGNFTPVVENLIRLDPVKYRAFDNVAAFILEGGLAFEQKALALHNLAHIYASLADLDAGFYTPGVAANLLQNAHLLEDERAADYVSAAVELLGVDAPVQLTFEGLLKRIDQLGRLPEVNTQDLGQVLNALKAYTSTDAFWSQDDRADQMGDLLAALRERIAQSPGNERLLNGLLEARLPELEPARTGFIPLNAPELEQAIDWETYLVQLTSGQLVEATYDRNTRTYARIVGNTRVAIRPDEYTGIPRAARPTSSFTSNRGQHVFSTHQLAGGLTMRPLDGVGEEQLQTRLAELGELNAGIRVQAVRVEATADERLQRLHALAGEDPRFAPLAARQHETFESAPQVKALHKGDSILTVGRMKASEGKYTLVGEVVGTGERFLLYGPNNFVFVNPDNSTESVDLTNPDHLQRVQQTAVVQDTPAPGIFEETPLSESQLKSLSLAGALFNAFDRQVQQQLSDNPTATSLDVSDAFQQHYSFGAARAPRVKVPLNEYMAQNPRIGYTVTVATVDGKGAVLGQEVRRIPFVFYRYGDNDFISAPLLGPNERLLDEKGGKHGVSSYVRNVLGIDQNAIRNQIIGEKNYEHVYAFMLSQREGLPPGYMLVEQKRMLSQVQEFAQMILGLDRLLELPASKRSYAFQQFSKNQYGFRAAKNKLRLDFSVGYSGKLQVELRAPEDSPYSEFIIRSNKQVGETGNSWRLNFPVDQPMIQRLAKALRGGKLVNQLRAAYPQLKEIVQTDYEGFYAELNRIVRAGSTDPLIKQLIANVQAAELQLGQMLKEQVADKIMDHLLNPQKLGMTPFTERDAKLFADFAELLKEDYTSERTGQSILHLLVSEQITNEAGVEGYAPRFAVGPLSSRKDYRTDLGTYDAITREPRKDIVAAPRTHSTTVVKSERTEPLTVSEVTAAPAVTDIPAVQAAPAVVDAPAAQAVPDVPAAPAATTGRRKVSALGLKKRGPLSLQDDVRAAASSDDILRESEWLSQQLPMLGIASEDVREMLDLTKLDGRVLGMYKNLFIYLNKSLTEKGTVFHEAFHGVFRHLLTQAERELLLQNVQGDRRYRKRFTEAALREFARKRNQPYDKTRTAALLVEEILADGFKAYMNKKTYPQPQGYFQKFLDLLRRVVNFFNTRQREIDTYYQRIDSGYYRQAVVQSGLYEGQVALELIEGIQFLHLDPETGEEENGGASHLTVDQQSQLVYKLAHEIVNHDLHNTDDTLRGLNFAQKFEHYRKQLYTQNFDIERLVAQFPDKEATIRAKLGPLYANYQFMLGKEMDAPESMSALNLTGNPEHDDAALDEDGAESVAQLKRIVFEVTRHFSQTHVEREQNVLTKDKAETILEGQEAVLSDEDAETESETTGDGDFDASFYGVNVLGGLPQEMRKFFSLVEYASQDAELGITLPRMIDGSRIFNTIMKVTSDTMPEHIVPRLKAAAAQFRYDGDLETARNLEAVYEKLAELTAMVDGVPTQNRMLYNQFMDVFHTTEIQYMLFNVTTERFNDTGDPQVDEQDMSVRTRVTLKDALLKADLARKKRSLVDGLTGAYSKVLHADTPANRRTRQQLVKVLAGKKKSEQALRQQAQAQLDELDKQRKPETAGYYQAVQRLLTRSADIRKSKATALVFAADANPQHRLNELTEELFADLRTIGLNLPKSLVRLSLIAIDTRENQVTPALGEESAAQQHYDQNRDLVAEGSYLQKDFFRDLDIILQALQQNKSEEQLHALIHPDQKSKTTSRFNAVLGKASVYMVKYDPSDAPSTVRNAENKPIYRYVKYTPAVLQAQQIRQEGLAASLRSSPFWTSQLEQWFTHNPIVQQALRAGNDPEKVLMKLFFDNLRVSAFGGVMQTQYEQMREGATFKTIDERSLYLTNLMGFMQREVLQGTADIGEGDLGVMEQATVELEVFNRSLTQLEASSTNFLVSAFYQRFYSDEGKVHAQKLLDSTGKSLGSYHRMTKVLEDVVRQEYARIQREWGTRAQRKQEFLDGTANNIILKYNGVYDKKGAVDTESRSLRAYRFNLLPDFFQTELEAKDVAKKPVAQQAQVQQLLDLRDELLEQAIGEEPKSFDELPTETREKLLQHLQAYALREADKNFARLQELGVVEYKTEKVYDLIDGIPELRKDKEGNPVQHTFLTAPLLPEAVTYDGAAFKSTKIEALYGLQEGKPNLKALLNDYFFNYWTNGLLVNQVFDGDMGMNVKNAVDYFKRNKAMLAAGSTMKMGTHTVSVVNTLMTMLHPQMLEWGQWDSMEHLAQELANAQEAGQTERAEALEKIQDYLLALPADKRGSKVFDGQTISLLMHQIDQFDTAGRLSEQALRLLIAKQYRALTRAEIEYLESGKIVMNSKKTVTASPQQYHKQSEHQLDRSDVSYLVVPEGMTEAQVHEELHALYSEWYNLRTQRQDMIVRGIQHGLPDPHQFETAEDLLEQMQGILREVHEYWKPLPHRQQLHDIINAMEYHQVDQFMDTEASKKVTMLPVNITDREDGYIPLHRSRSNVDNRFKYSQVETSGVAEKAKASVQSKVLIAADLALLAAEVSADPTASAEVKAGAADLARTLAGYQGSLARLTQSNLSKLKAFLRNEEGNFDVVDVFDMIRNSLQEQGASTNTLKLFAVENGQPVHSPNLPQIRRMLEYYFFSIYSTNVTDEKVAGFKSYHVTSYGYKLVYDKQTGAVIPTEQVRRNAELYADPAYYGQRYPGVRKEVKDGRTTYFVEVLLPKPFFDNEDHEAFYRQEMRQMFATRIPTEDKRSMIALEVVDFIDASYRNSIIVPQVVHELSGSDLDIDSLYGQTFAAYQDLTGRYHRYGKYDRYASATPAQAEYLEFAAYMSKHEAFKGKIKQARQQMRDANELPQYEQALPLMSALGFSEGEVRNVWAQPLYADEILDENGELISQAKQAQQQAYDDYVEAVRRHEEDVQNVALMVERGDASRELREAKARTEAVREQRKQAYEKIKRLNQVNKALFEITAMLTAFAQGGLPVNIADFSADPKWLGMLTPVHQNENLQHKLDILSNPAVFEKLYIREKSSTERFQRILRIVGVSPEEIANRYNPFTVDGVINVRMLNAMNKDGIAISASMNKFLSLASQYDLELHNGENETRNDIIWKLHMPELKDAAGQVIREASERVFNQFGGMNEEGMRAIALVGNIMGMFADGAKDPIPGALYMNEVNTPVTIAMVGLGLPVEMAVFLNLLQPVREAVTEVKAANYAVSLDKGVQRKMLANELRQRVQDTMLKEGNLFEEVQQAGVLRENSTSFNYELDMSKLRISFQAPESLDIRDLQAKTPTVTEMGFTIDVVTPAGGEEKILSEKAKELIVLKLYEMQAKQVDDITKAARLVGLFKKLNPSFVAVDKMRESVQLLKHNELIFRNSDQLFARGQVWEVLDRTLQDLHEQSAHLFIDRTQAFAPFTAMFGPLFEDKAKLAQVVTALFALRKLRSSHFADLEQNAAWKADQDNLSAVFTPDFWYGASTNPGVVTTFHEDLAYLKEAYPDNRALTFMRQGRSTGKATIELPDGSVLRNQGTKHVEQMGQTKLSGELAEGAIDDFTLLLDSPDGRVRRIARKFFYHELIRGALGNKRGMFLQAMNTDLLKETSAFVNQFVDVLRASEHDTEAFIPGIKQYLGLKSDEEFKELFDSLVQLTAHAALSDSQNNRVRTADRLSFSTGEYESGLMKAIDLTRPAEKLAQAHALVRYVFGLEEKVKLNDKAFNPLEKAGEVLQVTLHSTLQMPRKQLAAVATRLGIRANSPQIGDYQFPLLLKNPRNGETYILETLGGTTLSTMMASAMQAHEPVDLNGLEATYRRLSTELGVDAVSPLGYTLQEAKRFALLNNGKVNVKVQAPTVNEAAGEVAAPKQSTPAEAEEVTDPREPELDDMTGKGEEEFNESNLTNMSALFGMMGVPLPEASLDGNVEVEQGRYVDYTAATGETGLYIVTQILPNGLVQIYNPLLEGAESKRAVSYSTLSPRLNKAKFVSYDGSRYMITPKGAIISMKSYKRMEWAATHGTRRNIMAVVGDLESLNLTKDVLDTIYQQSSQKKDRAEFEVFAREMVENLRATQDYEQIIKALEC